MLAKAIVAFDSKKVHLRDIEIGEPGEWDIQVEIECCGLSVGTESFFISTASAERAILPGYAPVSRVTRVGARAAAHFAPGERVTYFQPRPPVPAANVIQLCGGYQSPAILNVNPAEKDLLAPNAYCVKVPPSLSSEAAAFAGISSVSYLGVDLSNPSPGNKVLIMGQGIIGLHATQHFALRGAEVCVADLHESRLKAASACGADHLIQPNKTDLVKAVLDRWPRGADIVVDTTASYRVIEQSLPALRTFGKYLFLGYYKADDFNLGNLHHRVFNAYFPWTLQGHLVASALKLMSMGALKSTEFITHRFPVAEAAQAYDLVYAHPDRYIGILMDWRK